MDKNAIKKYAVWARRELIARVSQRALQFGITEKKMSSADADSINGRLLSSTEKQQRRALMVQIEAKGFTEVMEEVAYTWFNRFSALRFMEVNGYLPTHIRVFTDEENNFKPQIIDEALHLDLESLNQEKVFAYKEANQTEELYKYLLITQCNALNKILPGMFQKISDYTELLLPDNLLREGSVIHQMIELIPEEDWKDAVQIIGWLYQYYISEKHDAIINIYKGTVSQKDVPAATQLFTTDWVVKYMVDNSVGRYWIERNPNSNLTEKLDFFVKPKDGVIHYVEETITPQDVTFFDPCMGSGHILAYAFDVLMDIYREYGYTNSEAVSEILQHNLHGFDIDQRCTQLAYFVVMMKARQYDARFFKRDIQPQVYYPKEDQNLRNFGSLLQLDLLDEKPCRTDNDLLFNKSFDVLLNDWNCRRLLVQKYAVVCTNPPYLNKYNSELKDFITKYYKNFSGDLFSVFMYRNFEFCKQNGYSAFMTPFVWMFIKTYEKLRELIINYKSITSLIQMEYSAFEEATVPICTFVLKNSAPHNKALCFRLSDFKGGMDVQEQKIREALSNTDCGYFYEADQANFSKIPGSPVAYWVSQNFIHNYEIGLLMDNVARPRQGMATCDNNRFLRKWYETDYNNINFTCKSITECNNLPEKWFPYNKGGDFRKWYGNNDNVINWKHNGKEVKDFAIKLYKSVTRTIKNIPFYFKEGITYTFISSSKFGVRFSPSGFIFDVAGSTVFVDKNKQNYVLALMVSSITKTYLDALNPTLNFQVGDIKNVPIVFREDKTITINEFVIQNLTLAQTDWDSFETSWDFLVHPLVHKIFSSGNRGDYSAINLENAYHLVKQDFEQRFQQLKANEEELNRIFIDIYGLQDELTPEVEDKDVTVYRYFDEKEDIPESMGSSRYALTKRDMIVSFISYAVGCMLGRYSLDMEGLAFAGGEWDDSKHPTFPADRDNILPICDDEYFDDDIVGRFVAFMKTVYGAETLEDNLRFIADALGGKGQPREIIRRYFLNDFFKDHCQTYQKRPVYWLFDSGRKNGFKALIYMHRYQPDTLARIRTDYVHEQQSRYRTAIADVEQRMTGAGTGERVKLGKTLSGLQEQETELRLYEEKIHHLADQMISIDLDDGVKHNYGLFQDVLAQIK